MCASSQLVSVVLVVIDQLLEIQPLPIDEHGVARKNLVYQRLHGPAQGINVEKVANYSLAIS